ncbi:MAG: hypothetical protein RL194_553 [Pseudomonadota bacterium]
MQVLARGALDFLIPDADRTGSVSGWIEASTLAQVHQRPSALTLSDDPRQRVQAIAYAGKCGVSVTADRLLDPRPCPVVAGTRGRNPYLLDF